MATSLKNPKFGQFINYYLDHDATGAHSPTGQPRTEKYLRLSHSLVDHYIPGSLRQGRYLELNPEHLQGIIDDTAYESDTAAHGIKRFIIDLENFALHIGIIDLSRAKNLSVPDANRRERVLNDRLLSEAWADLLRNAEVGGLPARLSCLAVIVSTATLQPLSSVLEVRRDWLRANATFWMDPTAGHTVYVPEVARPHLASAIAIGDLAHGLNGTPFVFPTVGAKSDPLIHFQFEKTHELIKLPLDDKTKPQDLVATGISRIREQGEVLGTIVDRLIGPYPAQSDAAHVVVLEAWCSQLNEMQKTIAAARWR